MTRGIGYYVHHHGAGHLHRAREIARNLSRPVTLIGTGLNEEAGIATLGLPDDRIAERFDGEDAAATRPQMLHYAPLDHDGIRRRVALITRWIAETRPALIVVDVSVEVALLARLASVPVVYVRLNGRRTDSPHLEAFRSAEALIAPYHADLDDPQMPDWVRARTRYFPGLVARMPHEATRGEDILIVAGKGGTSLSAEKIVTMANAHPELRIVVAGPIDAIDGAPDNLSFIGWRADVDRRIATAGCVVGAAGNGLVGRVLASGAPFICLPEARPFDEQRVQAAQLARHGAAAVVNAWPGPQEWPELIARAKALAATRPDHLHHGDGGPRAAEWIDRIAAAHSGEAP